MQHTTYLKPIGVLELIHQHERMALRKPLPHLRILAEDLAHVNQQLQGKVSIIAQHQPSFMGLQTVLYAI